MRNQNQIIEPCNLLDDSGLLINPGYAVKPFWQYDRRKIKAGWYRIKEWDYYLILAPDKEYGIALTLSDLGYIGFIAVCWFDFKNRSFSQFNHTSILPMGRMKLPPGSDQGISAFENKKIKINIEVSGNQRVISFDVPAFVGNKMEKGLKGTLILYQDPAMDSMVIATSWKENPKAFYYNQKINCMPVEGVITVGEQNYEFSTKTSFGTLDWGRGNWTYKNRWYWGSASGFLNGESFGWNLGYGFSDRSPASENMVFYKNKAHKLDEIVFHMDTENYVAPWKITSSDNRFEMEFEPIFDRASSTDIKVMKSIQHQVFGYFNGRVILDDGTVLQVKDFLGFNEDVLNWW